MLDYKNIKDDIDSLNVITKPQFGNNRRLKRPMSKSVGRYKASAIFDAKNFIDG